MLHVYDRLDTGDYVSVMSVSLSTVILNMVVVTVMHCTVERDAT